MNQYDFQTDMYLVVAKNIKKYRELKGLSIKELAKYTDIRESFLKEFEEYKEGLTISIYDLYKISVILDVSIQYFFK